MTQFGTVISIQIQAAHGERPLPRAEVRALVGYGLEGDLHGKTRPDMRRQVLVVDTRTVAAFGLRPGDLREQITVDFAPLEALSAGTHLRIGQATLELTGSCEPCTRIGKLNRLPDTVSFQNALEGRRGQLARIVAVDGDGFVRVGDPVAVAVLR